MPLERSLKHSPLRPLLVAVVVLGCGFASAATLAQAATASTASFKLKSAPEWHELSPKQRQTLAPLAGQWSKLDALSRDKWVNVTDRYGKLSPDEQQLIQERMKQWASLPPHERGEARLRFQQTRQLSPTERQEKWAAYQALPEADRDDLMRQAQRKAKPVFIPDAMPGPREPAQAFNGKHQTAQTSPHKNNMVPNALSGTSPSPTLVAPTLIKAGRGATTNLLTQTPMPPLHQHSGLPKISATKGFVDPVTLLPQKGAQSAAMASLPSTGTDQAARR